MTENILIQLLNKARVRLRLALCWRTAFIGGIAGCVVGIALDLLDTFNILMVSPFLIPLSLFVGIAAGAIYSFVRRISLTDTAVMADKRAGLQDRIQTALERVNQNGAFDKELHDDAAIHLSSARISALFPIRFTRVQSYFAVGCVLFFLVHYWQYLPIVNPPEKKQQLKQISETAKQVERVSKPLQEHAQKYQQDAIQKKLIADIKQMQARANSGKLSKKDALVKLNQIKQQANQIEQANNRDMKLAASRISNIQRSAEMGAMAQQELEKMTSDFNKQMESLEQQLKSKQGLNGKPLTQAQMESMKNQLKTMQNTMNALHNQDALGSRQMQDLMQQMKDIEKMLQQGKDMNGKPLTKEQINQLKQMKESLKQQIKALELSKKAQEFLQKLANDPKFKEAMKKMQELSSKCNGACDNSSESGLSDEELADLMKQAEALQKAIEEMAQKYSDADIKKLAEDILNQVEQMKQLAQCQNSLGQIQIACMSLLPGPTSQLPGWKDRQFEKDVFVGQPEKFNQGNKSTDLKIPPKSKPIAGKTPSDLSQSSYTEFKAPPTPNSSVIPLSKALPSYQKKAEAALNKKDVPPAERKRVKRYFESLKEGK